MAGLTKEQLLEEANMFLDKHKGWVNSEIRKEIDKGKNVFNAEIQSLKNFNEVILPSLLVDLITKNNEAINDQLK